eukprot:3211367-Amphidinium_carterae.1
MHGLFCGQLLLKIVSLLGGEAGKGKGRKGRGRREEQAGYGEQHDFDQSNQALLTDTLTKKQSEVQ